MRRTIGRAGAMPPKFDPTAVNYVYLRCVGGEAAATSALAPKIGPLGLPPKKISDQIAANTKDWKGLKVTIQLKIQNRQAEVSVVPTAAALIIRALNEPARDRKKVKNVKHDGNISFETVVEIAKQMSEKSMSRTLTGVVKEVLGTAVSVGCKVDNMNPQDVIEQVQNGEREIPE